jgi:hypothetical protein
MLRHVRLFWDAIMLDAVYSDGYFSRLLLAAGAKHVHGVDYSETMMILHAKRSYTRRLPMMSPIIRACIKHPVGLSLCYRRLRSVKSQVHATFKRFETNSFTSLS